MEHTPQEVQNLAWIFEALCRAVGNTREECIPHNQFRPIYILPPSTPHLAPEILVYEVGTGS